jgi:hypothetical protein
MHDILVLDCCHGAGGGAVQTMRGSTLSALVLLAVWSAVKAQCYDTTVGFYKLQCDAHGNIVSPWASVAAALDAEMAWYARSPPAQYGLPTWMYSTFVDGNYSIELPQVPYCVRACLYPSVAWSHSPNLHSRRQGLEVIAAMQDGMAIISYLKYWQRMGARADDVTLRLATQVGDFLLTQALTAPVGVYNNVTRSSGFSFEWPETCASQDDMLFGTVSRPVECA